MRYAVASGKYTDSLVKGVQLFDQGGGKRGGDKVFAEMVLLLAFLVCVCELVFFLVVSQAQKNLKNCGKIICRTPYRTINSYDQSYNRDLLVLTP